MFPTDYAIAPDELARAVEERGFESLWFPEHTHIPASRRSPGPAAPSCRSEYWHTYDLFVALAAAAARDQAPQARHRHLPRRSSATRSSPPRRSRPSIGSPSGRFLFGIGGGWNAEEMENHGTDLQDALAAAARADAGDEGDLDGGRGRVPRRVRNFDPIWSRPKPVQKPHPPIIIGGDGRRTFERVVEYGDGWMPIMRGNMNPVARIPELRAPVERAGRDPKSVPVSTFSRRRDARAGGAERPASSAPSSACHPSRATSSCRASTPTRR